MDAVLVVFVFTFVGCLIWDINKWEEMNASERCVTICTFGFIPVILYITLWGTKAILWIGGHETN